MRILKTRYFLVFIFSFCCWSRSLPGYAQTLDWAWARNAISITSVFTASEGYSIACDKSDNLFIGGFYLGTIAFWADKLSGGATQHVWLAIYDGQVIVRWDLGRA